VLAAKRRCWRGGTRYRVPATFRCLAFICNIARERYYSLLRSAVAALSSRTRHLFCNALGGITAPNGGAHQRRCSPSHLLRVRAARGAAPLTWRPAAAKEWRVRIGIALSCRVTRGMRHEERSPSRRGAASGFAARRHHHVRAAHCRCVFSWRRRSMRRARRLLSIEKNSTQHHRVSAVMAARVGGIGHRAPPAHTLRPAYAAHRAASRHPPLLFAAHLCAARIMAWRQARRNARGRSKRLGQQ